MSLKRRVLILTEAQYATLRRAMIYVDDMYSVGQGDGDITDQWARANERVAAVVNKAPIRGIKYDADALTSVLHAACENACSCAGGQKIHKASGHETACWNAMRHHQIERVLALLALLRERS